MAVLKWFTRLSLVRGWLVILWPDMVTWWKLNRPWLSLRRSADIRFTCLVTLVISVLGLTIEMTLLGIGVKLLAVTEIRWPRWIWEKWTSPLHLLTNRCRPGRFRTLI